MWRGGAHKNGYGSFWFEGRKDKAHRVAWRLAVGPIPTGILICHRCDQPLCVNPGHLFLGTPADNMADRDAKGRAAIGERHGRAKMTVEQVREIRSLRGIEPYRSIARRYGLARSTVWAILDHSNWRAA